MNIVSFGQAHAVQAMQLAQAEYEAERSLVPSLPQTQVPDLRGFTCNGLGVAAFDGNTMVGFLCVHGPFKRAFGSTDVKGVYSPMHGHAAIGDKARVYHRMYQAAAGKWVAAGALSHGVTLYAHDEAAKQAWFTYGFGMCCVDAIKLLEAGQAEGDFFELPQEKAGDLRDLNNLLIDHLGSPPCFMKGKRANKRRTAAKFARPDVRIFAARREGGLVAYLKLRDGGENFACDAPDMLNICGAYATPGVRGTGLYAGLLRYTEAILAEEGYIRLGVDFESFNPTALEFWSKHFTAYTHSVVRRIDERGNR